LIVAWGGPRTPLAFVVALLAPVTVASGAPFPDRDLVLVFTAALVVASAVLQGTTVSALARSLALTGDEGVRREEQIARARVMQAGRERSLAIQGGGSADQPDGRLAVFDAERAALVHLYDADEIGEETLLRLRQEIDAEAQRVVGGSSDFAHWRPRPRRPFELLRTVREARSAPFAEVAVGAAIPPRRTQLLVPGLRGRPALIY
jgi:NhaP-type Na+/H+ or K+/H+ antiporter